MLRIFFLTLLLLSFSFSIEENYTAEHPLDLNDTKKANYPWLTPKAIEQLKTRYIEESNIEGSLKIYHSDSAKAILTVTYFGLESGGKWFPDSAGEIYSKAYLDTNIGDLSKNIIFDALPKKLIKLIVNDTSYTCVRGKQVGDIYDCIDADSENQSQKPIATVTFSSSDEFDHVWDNDIPKVSYGNKIFTDFVKEKEYPTYYFYQLLKPCSVGRVWVSIDVYNKGYVYERNTFANQEPSLDSMNKALDDKDIIANCKGSVYNFQEFQDVIYAKDDLLVLKRYFKDIDQVDYMWPHGVERDIYLHGKQAEYEDFIKDNMGFAKFMDKYLKKIKYKIKYTALLPNDPRSFYSEKELDKFLKNEDKPAIILDTPYIVGDSLVARLFVREGSAELINYYDEVKIKYDEVEPYLTDSIKKYFKK